MLFTLSLILFLAVFSSFLVALMLLFNQRKTKNELYQTTALLLSLIGFSILSVYVVKDHFSILPKFIEDIFSLLFYVAVITIPPTIYNVVVLVLGQKDKKYTKIYFFSYVLLLINCISYFYLSFKSDSSEFLYDVIENVMNYSNFSAYIFAFPVMAIIYSIKTIRIYTLYSKKYFQENSGLLKESWVIQFQIGYILFIILFILSSTDSFAVLFGYIFLCYSILFLFYFNIKIFSYIKTTDKAENNVEDESVFNQTKYFSEIAFKLTKVIEEDRPYLDAKLTIYQLAKLIDSNEKYLSHYLNCVHEVNFYTYINNFRIEEAKKLLLSEEAENYTIETIANMSGFHSKSSFNSAFKKSTEMTPSEYRKIHIY